MAKSAFFQLFAITLFLFTETSFGETCGYRNSSYPVVKIGDLFLYGVPEDDELWLNDRGYLNSEERKKDLTEAVKIQDSEWVEKNRKGEISSLEEDKILAAYLVKKATREFNEQASVADKSIAKLKRRSGVSQKEIARLKAKLGFFTVKYVLWPNAKFPEFEKDRAVLRETLNSIQVKLESAPKK